MDLHLARTRSIGFSNVSGFRLACCTLVAGRPLSSRGPFIGGRGIICLPPPETSSPRSSQRATSCKLVIDYNVVRFDPTRHMKSWRTAWRTLTRKAGRPGFRFHDLRHCAITQLAENGTSDSTIMAIAGHVSRRMLERYSHVRMEAKRTAMESLALSTKTAGYDTKHDTNAARTNARPV